MADLNKGILEGRSRIAAGAGLSLGAALGMGATAEAATFNVTSLGDSGAGTLRKAIIDSNAAAGADQITFQSGLTGQITLTTGTMVIGGPVEILGPGADKLTVSGNNAAEILYVNPITAYSPVTISGLTLRDGKSATDGGAINNADAALTVDHTVITQNTALTGADDGGAIANFTGDLVVRFSTISGNSASDEGGAISNFNPHMASPGSVVIESSTISGNHSVNGGNGSGIFTYSTDPFTIRNSTITGNSTTVPGGDGGGIDAIYTDPVLLNTIVADNVSPNAPDIFNLPAQSTTSATFSLIENTTGTILTGTPNITGQDPKLGPLGDNGGPTPTQALLTGSPALDKGSVLAVNTDQRGAPRPFNLAGIMSAPGGNTADIGAYERVLCAKVVVNRVGTDLADKIKGTKGADGILGLAGKDELSGLAGPDALCGGGAKDTLRGGGGNDKLLGQGGPDKLIGGKGKDKLTGGPGKDKQTQ